MPPKKKSASVPPGNWTGPPNSSGVRAGESFLKSASVRPGNWMGPPNSSGVRAGESFFEGPRRGVSALRSPSPRNDRRGASAPTHIGMLPNNVIRKINELAGTWTLTPTRYLGHAISDARTLRSLKGLMLILSNRSNPSLRFYDPKYQTVITTNNVRRNAFRRYKIYPPG